MVNIGQKIFNPLQHRTSNINTPGTIFNHDAFQRLMLSSFSKAVNSIEGPPKEKHVRKLLIGTYQTESGDFFWDFVVIAKLRENQIYCWKFLQVVHRLIRDGHRNFLMNSYKYRQSIFLECGNMWLNSGDSYGDLIHLYCSLLYNRMRFHKRNPMFPNDLKLTDKQLLQIGENGSHLFFDLACGLFDILEDILSFQELVLKTLDLKKYNSLTTIGQSHLSPLVSCLQDSTLIYDYLVKMMFRLHSELPVSTLEGHRDRFYRQHKSLKTFYSTTSNLQFFKTLIQIPDFSEKPPNFLISTEINEHVTPIAVMIPSASETDVRDGIQTSSQLSEQLLVDFDDESPPESTNSTRPDSEMLDRSDHFRSSQSTFNQSENSELTIASNIEGNKQQIEEINQLEDKIALQQSSFEAEKECLAREIDHHKENIQRLNSLIEDKEKKLTQLNEDYSKLLENEKLLCNQVEKLKSDLKTATNENVKLAQDYKRAKHDCDIAQEAVKRMMKDLSELRNKETEFKLQQAKMTPPTPEPIIVPTEGIKNLELENDVDLEELLTKEMNESDKIIKEVSEKIQQLSEKSRKSDSGIRLEVNEKISGSCSSLMDAVVRLIQQSRVMQKEIVQESLIKGRTKNSADFYKQNSIWTDGLISAAKVVATAAKSLVQSSDRCMSGQGSFSELAAAAHEIAAATMQLLVASRVKAKPDSEILKKLSDTARQVNMNTGNVVATAKICAQIIESSADIFDINSLSLHQTKKLEMECQVHILELEAKLERERVKLGALRKRHYEQEEIALQDNQ